MKSPAKSSKRSKKRRQRPSSAYLNVNCDRQRTDRKGRPRAEAEPTHYTRRRPERETFGDLAFSVSQWLGLPLMPWQRLVADVALEYRKTDYGIEFYYDRILYTVPRQSGKTWLAFVLAITRALLARNASIGWTAQNYTEAGNKWKNELFKTVRSSQMKDRVRCFETNGGIKVLVKQTQSSVEVMNVGQGRGHGPTRHAVFMDEIYEFKTPRVMDGITPSLSRRDSQLYLFSTAGDEASELLDSFVRIGRRSARRDRGHGTAYFEWSAPRGWESSPAIYADAKTWWPFMPALGHIATERTIKSDLRAARQLESEGHEGSVASLFIRPYGNLPDRVRPGWRGIGGESRWRSCSEYWSSELDDDEQPVFALAATSPDDGDKWAISVAVDGLRAGLVEVFDSPIGVADRCNELTERYDTVIAYDRLGPAAALFGVDEDSRDRVRNGHGMDSSEVTAATASLLSDLKANNVAIRPDPRLDRSAETVGRKKVGDRIVWQRSELSAPIESTTLALAASATAIERSSETDSSVYDDDDHGLIVI